MTELTEMEQRVLAELEEFWEENVFAMLNTILGPKGDTEEVRLLQQALRGLVERDYVTMGYEGFVPKDPEELSKDASLVLVSDLADWFRFDPGTSYWTLSKGDIKKERIPVIYLSEAGQQKVTQILTERGYQWWRPKE